MRLADVRKALTALAGAVAFVITSGTVHGTALLIAQIVIGVLTASGVYQVPNGSTSTPEVPPAS